MELEAHVSGEYERAVQEAIERLEKASKRLRKEAQDKLDQAVDLSCRAQGLRMVSAPQEIASGPLRIGNWNNVKPAQAMHQYMRENFGVGVHVNVAKIAKDLMAGGCIVAGKLRAKSDKSVQAAAERKIFQIAAQNKLDYGRDRTGREIWRI